MHLMEMYIEKNIFFFVRSVSFELALICSGCHRSTRGGGRSGWLARLSLCESAEVENKVPDGEVGFKGTDCPCVV